MFAAPRALSIRPRVANLTAARVRFAPQCRTYASDPSKDLPKAENQQAPGPNMQQQEHVSEEAAKMAQMQGGEGPDLSQGTPVQEILKDDNEAQQNAPQVLKDSLKTKAPPPKPGTRPFSTYARRRQGMGMADQGLHDQPVFPFRPENASTEVAKEMQPQDIHPGHKYPLPILPLPSNMHKDYRYDPVIKQITNLMMRDGKLSVAQKNMSALLQHLRTSPPPSYNPNRPLMPGARKPTRSEPNNSEH